MLSMLAMSSVKVLLHKGCTLHLVLMFSKDPKRVQPIAISPNVCIHIKISYNIEPLLQWVRALSNITL